MINASDIKKYLSGGTGNADPTAALGGAISSTEIVDNTINNLFAAAPASESEAGSTKYRCFFVKNTHATLTYKSAKIYISTNTPSGSTNVQIGLAVEDGSPAGTIVNENSAPAGVSFSDAATIGAALNIGDLAAGACKAIWVKWVITAGASAVNDVVVETIKGESEA